MGVALDRAAALIRSEASLVLAALCGFALRTWRLPGQILVGDEWHALHKAADDGFAGIFTSFGTTDHSIPVSAYYELASRTVGLTDAVVRAPFLAAGMATVVGLPLLVRRASGKAVGDAWAWLLATSPLLVLYSRFARPYGIATLACVLALFAFAAWWRGRRRAQAALYSGSVLVAGACLVICLPFALAPFAFHAVRLARGRSGDARRDLRALAGLAAVTGIPLALVLLPAFVADTGSLTSKLGSGFQANELGLAALRMFSGADGALGLVPFLALGVLGTVHLRSRRPAAAWWPLALTATAVQLAFVVLLSPGHPFTFSRYALPVLPVLLLLPASGVATLAERSRARAAGALLAPIVAALPLFLGPLRVLRHGPDNWLTVHLTQAIGGAEQEVAQRIRRVPEFYRALAREPAGSVTLIETPLNEQMALNPLPYYQRIHRQWTRIGFLNGLVPEERRLGEMPYGSPRLESRNFLYVADLVDLAEPPGDYVVLHRDLHAELAVEKLPLLRTVVDDVALDPAPVIAAMQARFGPPVDEDESITVFALRPGH